MALLVVSTYGSGCIANETTTKVFLSACPSCGGGKEECGVCRVVSQLCFLREDAVVVRRKGGVCSDEGREVPHMQLGLKGYGQMFIHCMHTHM